MRPGPAAVCRGTVTHRRASPRVHEFTYPVSYVWFDPDRPAALTDHHWAWSDRRPAPVRYRRADYGAEPAGSLVQAALADLAGPLGRRPSGPVRMLSQVRRFGWLFNPLTVFLAWDGEDGPGPVGAVLEVTNTPWKQRTRYAVGLVPDGDASGRWTARFPKRLHVSPFLDEQHVYDLTITGAADRLVVGLDVRRCDGEGALDAEAVLRTRLDVRRTPADRRALRRALCSAPVSTYQVSAAIHLQALRLWRAGVPFVAHPGRA